MLLVFGEKVVVSCEYVFGDEVKKLLLVFGEKVGGIFLLDYVVGLCFGEQCL